MHWETFFGIVNENLFSKAGLSAWQSSMEHLFHQFKLSYRYSV